MRSDQRGNCVSCYKDYKLTSYKRCVYNAEGKDASLPQQENNPLCSKFQGVNCLACVQGCYMNSGVCKVPDPNCARYDIVNEKCTLCMEGYELQSGKKWCVRSKCY
jgi:hypothetical protein